MGLNKEVVKKYVFNINTYLGLVALSWLMYDAYPEHGFKVLIYPIAFIEFLLVLFLVVEMMRVFIERKLSKSGMVALAALCVNTTVIVVFTKSWDGLVYPLALVFALIVGVVIAAMINSKK